MSFDAIADDTLNYVMRVISVRAYGSIPFTHVGSGAQSSREFFKQFLKTNANLNVRSSLTITL